MSTNPILKVISENESLREQLEAERSLRSEALTAQNQLKYERDASIEDAIRLQERAEKSEAELASLKAAGEGWIPPKESQASITQWADTTFGTDADALRVARRAMEELQELIEELEHDPQSEKAPEECADVAIALYLTSSRLSADLHGQIDLKMAVNRKREWRLDGTGCGYHIKPAERPAAKEGK